MPPSPICLLKRGVGSTLSLFMLSIKQGSYQEHQPIKISDLIRHGIKPKLGLAEIGL